MIFPPLLGDYAFQGLQGIILHFLLQPQYFINFSLSSVQEVYQRAFFFKILKCFFFELDLERISYIVPFGYFCNFHLRLGLFAS